MMKSRVYVCACVYVGVVGLLLRQQSTSFVGSTPLDDYINKLDSNYRWHDTGHRLNGRFLTGTWEGVILNLTSQEWLSLSEVDRPIWTHYLVILTPKRIEYETAFLLIGGGSNAQEPPTARDELLLLAAALAVKTKTLAAVVYQVPNQPLQFVSDTSHSLKSEDDIIAYTWAHFFKDTRRGDWPAHIPMTKATIRAMDTVEAYASNHLNLQVDSFVVGGASKRGWTTWLTGAVDKRVVGIVPMVMDLLNSVKNLHHFYRSLGAWPDSFKPYYACNVTANLDTPEFSKLMEIVDPYVYVHRLTMPKLIITSSNDEFFLLDDSKYFWNDLKGEKYHVILANTDHNLFTGLPKLLAATEAFHLSIALDRQRIEQPIRRWTERSALRGKHLPVQSRPTFSWNFNRTSGRFVVNTFEEPQKATLWYAYTIPSNGRRDFRWLTANLGNCSTFIVSRQCFQPIFFRPRKLRPTSFTSSQNALSYDAVVDLPKEGYGAYFVELKFKGPQKSSPFFFTTEAIIAPNVYPFSDCSGVSCKGTMV